MKTTLATLVSALALGACTNMPMGSTYSQDTLPENVRVPAGHMVAWETVGSGDITYECRDKANMPGQTEWVFVGPRAVLKDRAGRAVGSYYGPPATWEASDGSPHRHPAGSGPAGRQSALPARQGQPGHGPGRPERRHPHPAGGPAGWRGPASECSAATRGKRETVTYQADYIFWKAR
jgi:hypothetical protein